MLFQYLIGFSIFLAGSCLHQLNVDETLYNQELKDKGSKHYKVDNLLIGARYEVRISYPSVIPTDFVIDVGTEESFSSRKLLNVEQLQFNAQHKVYYVKVTAHRTGVPLFIERLSDPVWFNIIVNRLYLGCSIATWKIIVVGVILNALGVWFIIPRVVQIIQDYCEKTDHVY